MKTRIFTIVATAIAGVAMTGFVSWANTSGNSFHGVKSLPNKSEFSTITRAPLPAQYSNAFLFGESIPKKRDRNDEPRFGIDAERIEWWLGDPDGTNLRKLNDPKAGRVKVLPVDRTVILFRDQKGITLLGPDGADLHFSFTEGPMKEAEIEQSGQRTTFAFGPDGKHVYFINKKENLCRINLATQELFRYELSSLNRSDSIQFSPDGRQFCYSKYRRPDDLKPGIFSVFVADLSGQNEKMITESSAIGGFGFLPDGRLGVVTSSTVQAFDITTGKSEMVYGPPDVATQLRGFGGFNPDGSSFIYDTGGPYHLNLYMLDLKAKKIITVRKDYLESFQEMVWVRILKTP